MNIVWFKRDFRVHDHEPLKRAIGLGPTVGLCIVEPEWLDSAEFSWDHFRFFLDGLAELKTDLQALGVPLVIRSGSAIPVFNELLHQHPIHKIFSHEETGLEWSFRRDLAMKSWCRDRGIPWQESRQFGVIRGLKDRDLWAEKRQQIIERKPLTTIAQNPQTSPWPLGELPSDELRGKSLKTDAQKGGTSEAKKLLQSFLGQRGQEYFREISSPNSAFESCSRLSPYIAWGHISLTQIHEALLRKQQSLEREPFETRKYWQLSLKNFESRLWWHCHFVQKLESEPAIEFQNFNRQFDGLRESAWDEAKFQAWCQGRTGFPLIDACMRALHQHGWINFRMRAMLMSFATYQLWLHWKKPAIYLAQHFLDFEPGIHYSQVQMQSGVTGINTIRIYSPKKQLQDQDPESAQKIYYDWKTWLRDHFSLRPIFESHSK